MSAFGVCGKARHRFHQRPTNYIPKIVLDLLASWGLVDSLSRREIR